MVVATRVSFLINRFERKRTRDNFSFHETRLNLRFFLSRPFFPSSCSFSQENCVFLYFYTQIPSPLFVFFLDVLVLVFVVVVVNSHEGGEGRGTLTLTFLKMNLSFFD